MRVTRRKLLAATSAMALARWPGAALAQFGPTVPLFLLLRGVPSLRDADTAVAVIAAFTDLQLPIVVEIDDLEDDRWGKGALLHLFGRLGRNNGLVEIALAHQPRDRHHRYLQLRDAVELKNRLSSLFGAIDRTLPDDMITLVSAADDPGIDPHAYGAAGFRVEIRLPSESRQGETMELEQVDWGLIRLSKGLPLSIGADPAATLGIPGFGQGGELLVLDVSDEAGDVVERCRLWSGALDDGVKAGRYLITRPRDYLLQGNPGASKYLSVILEGPLGEENAAFAVDLAEIDIPFTLVGDVPPEDLPAGAGFCANDAEQLRDMPGALCLRVTGAGQTGEPITRARVILAEAEPGGIQTGPQADGRFHVAMQTGEGNGLIEAIETQPMTDRAVLVQTTEIDTPIKRAGLLRRLDNARREGRVNLVTVETLRNTLSPPDPVVSRFWSARDRALSYTRTALMPDAAERARLMEDAVLAWTYVEQYTDSTTGLCAGTVQRGSGFDLVNPEITLWDVASQIRAIMAADRLGLIDNPSARHRIAQVFDATPSVTIEGLRVPPAIFSAKTLRAARISFDACDTGRFLLALAASVSQGYVDEATALALLRRWDLGGVVRDGHPFSHVQGQWVDTFDSHCTDYIAAGFAFAGLDVASPYPRLGQDPDADARIALLYKAGDIGHFGPEPALLAAVEEGQSPEAAYLTDVLFDAQLGWFEETGRYRCVSEVPVNVEPWFIYQGLRVDLAPGDAWVVVAPARRDREATILRNADDMRLISTKSAFLWAATHDHPHSREVLALVRDRARLEGLGFSAGLYEDGLAPLAGYTDLNTNGIILSAIARMWAG